MTKKEIMERLEKDFGMEILIHTAREYSYEVLHKAVKDYMNVLEQEGREHVYMFATCLVIDDKSIGYPPTDLWIRFYE